MSCFSAMALRLLASSPLLAGAWFDTGHMLVAHIAKSQLPKAHVDTVDQILSTWSTDFPGMSDFIGGAVWADHIKCTNSEAPLCSGLPATALGACLDLRGHGCPKIKELKACSCLSYASYACLVTRFQACGSHPTRSHEQVSSLETMVPSCFSTGNPTVPTCCWGPSWIAGLAGGTLLTWTTIQLLGPQPAPNCMGHPYTGRCR